METPFLVIVIFSFLTLNVCQTDDPFKFEEKGDDTITLDDSPFESGTCNSGECSYVPHSAFIPCDRVWEDFYECDEPLDLRGNETARTELGFGCSRVSYR